VIGLKPEVHEPQLLARRQLQVIGTSQIGVGLTIVSKR
jgi:hypothetical protein